MFEWRLNKSVLLPRFCTHSSSPASFVALHTTSPCSLWVPNIEANEFTVESPASGEALVWRPGRENSLVSLQCFTHHISILHINSAVHSQIFGDLFLSLGDLANFHTHFKTEFIFFSSTTKIHRLQSALPGCLTYVSIQSFCLNMLNVHHWYSLIFLCALWWSWLSWPQHGPQA